MQEKFDGILRGLLPEGEAALLAVSGGADSLCMAELFRHSALRPRFAVAHAHFGLRGADSDADEAFVRQWAEEAGVPFYSCRFDTVAYAEAEGLGIEEAARELRYRWFGRLCRQEGYAFVATAHQADDNAETLLLNLIRGCGLQGLCGMPFRRPAPACEGAPYTLIRPMLLFRRPEIEAYLHAAGLTPRIDGSNADVRYRRNYVRHRVMPLLASLNPSVVEALTRTMRSAGQALDVVDEYVRREGASLQRRAEGRLLLAPQLLKTHPRRSLLLYSLLSDYGFSQDTLNRLDALLDRSELPSGLRFVGKGRELLLSRDVWEIRPTDSASGRDGVCPLPFSPSEDSAAHLSFRDGEVRLACRAWSAGEDPHCSGAAVLLDAECLGAPLLLRPWREGDAFCPLGLKNASGRPGRKKVSDLLTDLVLTRADKERVCVLEAGGKVVAVLGFGLLKASFGRIDVSCRVTKRTRRVLALSLTGLRGADAATEQ